MRIGPGEIVSDQSWEFVGKFAFNYNEEERSVVGRVAGSIEVDRPAFLAVYDDEVFSWATVYNNDSLTCEWALREKKNGGPVVRKWRLQAHHKNAIHISINEHLRPRMWYFAIIAETCVHEEAQQRLDLHAVHWLGGEEAVPAAKLPSRDQLGRVHVDLVFLNTAQGWQRHFGFDELGSLPLTLILLFAYGIGFAWHLMAEAHLERQVRGEDVRNPGKLFIRSSGGGRASGAIGDEGGHGGGAGGGGGDDAPALSIGDGPRTHHGFYAHAHSAEQPAKAATARSAASVMAQARVATPLVKLWSVLILFELGSLIFRSIDLAVYAIHGETATRFRWGRVITLNIFSKGMDILSHLGLMLAVMLVAQGWTISSPGIRNRSCLGCSMTMVALLEIAMYIWAALVWDPASTLYIYESPQGVIVLVERVVVMLWFLRSIQRTHHRERYNDRRCMYKVFGLMYGSWFMSLPGVVLLSSFIAPYWRFRIVDLVVRSVHFLALASFAIIFWPTWNSKYFAPRTDIQGSLGEHARLLNGDADGFDDDDSAKYLDYAPRRPDDDGL